MKLYIVSLRHPDACQDEHEPCEGACACDNVGYSVYPYGVFDSMAAAKASLQQVADMVEDGELEWQPDSRDDIEKGNYAISDRERFYEVEIVELNQADGERVRDANRYWLSSLKRPVVAR